MPGYAMVVFERGRAGEGRGGLVRLLKWAISRKGSTLPQSTDYGQAGNSFREFESKFDFFNYRKIRELMIFPGNSCLFDRFSKLELL